MRFFRQYEKTTTQILRLLMDFIFFFFPGRPYIVYFRWKTGKTHTEFLSCLSVAMSWGFLELDYIMISSTPV